MPPPGPAYPRYPLSAAAAQAVVLHPLLPAAVHRWDGVAAA